MNVTTRNLWGEEEPAEVLDLDNGAIAVSVGFLGHLVFSAEAPGGPRAVLTQGPGRENAREVVTLEDRWEVELLPHTGGGDRVVVVVRP